VDSALAVSSVIFTAVLVIITGFYAWQTRRMVQEMHNARGAGIRPNISLSVRLLEGGSAYVILENTGLGPGMAVDVTLAYEPGTVTHRWSTSVMPIGEQARFLTRDLVQTYEQIQLSGRCFDALGDLVEITGEVQLRELWDATGQAQIVLEDDPAAKTATELGLIRQSIERLVAELERPISGRPAKAETGTDSEARDASEPAPVSIRRTRAHRGPVEN
jgi:HAMP domain-containing protein